MIGCGRGSRAGFTGLLLQPQCLGQKVLKPARSVDSAYDFANIGSQQLLLLNAIFARSAQMLLIARLSIIRAIAA